MKRRIALSVALFAGLIVFAAADAKAFNVFNRSHGGCCEPSCCAPEPTCGCDNGCDHGCGHRRHCGLFGGLFGHHRGHGCHEATCCAEPVCAAPVEATCCARAHMWLRPWL